MRLLKIINYFLIKIKWTLDSKDQYMYFKSNIIIDLRKENGVS